MKSFIARLIVALLLTGAVSAPALSQTVPPLDPAAVVLSPLDSELAGFLHIGAFRESIADEAENLASYRNHDVETEEVDAILTAAGRGVKYVALLGKPSVAPAGNYDEVVRSYVTTFRDADSAASAFAVLEDETGAVGAEDREPGHLYGEQTDLTYDAGFDAESRPFRSLDLTFRVGSIIAGVALVAYPSAAGIEPDQAFLEELAGVLEARVINPPVNGIGSSSLVLDPSATVTLDDAYYRTDGQDVPLADEGPDASERRTSAYGEAVNVYQVFQTVESSTGDSALYSNTLYEFDSAEDASGWMELFPDLLGPNSYYSGLEVAASQPADLPAAEVGMFMFSPNGTGVAPLLLARQGAVVSRIQIIPLVGLEAVPADIAVRLMVIQLGCLQSGMCSPTPAEAIIAGLPVSATPEAPSMASPVASPVA